MKNGLTFYKPMMYVGHYGDDGSIDTDSVVAIGPARFTSDGIELDLSPRTYEDTTPAGTFTYDTGVLDAHTASGTIKFSNMKELAQLAGGVAGSDATHGRIDYGSNTSCPTVKDAAVVIVDVCDAENTYKMVKIDHADVVLFTDSTTIGGSDPFAVPFQVYAHPDNSSANRPAIQIGTETAGQVFDPTTWTIKPKGQ